MRCNHKHAEEKKESMKKLSVIIPTYNEESTLPMLFKHLEQLSPYEVILVDGGSRDQTCRLLQSWAQGSRGRFRQTVISSPRGRANQMNEGAKSATGSFLLFLHADSRLPPDGIEEVLNILKDSRFVGGAFRLTIDSSHPFLKFVAFMANLRSSGLKLPYGDQGYFVRKAVFERMRGYREIGLMEDVDFFRRLKKEGRVVLLKGEMTTSPRRWRKRGYFLNSLKNAVILFLYFFRISPGRLARWYYS